MKPAGLPTSHQNFFSKSHARDTINNRTQMFSDKEHGEGRDLIRS
jgi:hypothetical protein